MKHKIGLIGMVWYTAEDFDKAKAVMTDTHTLHRTYAEWEAAAKNGERQLTAQGHKVIRATINPTEFVSWCRANGHNVDSNGRNAFANWAAMEAQRNIHG